MKLLFVHFKVVKLNQAIPAAELDSALISEFSETLSTAQAVRSASWLRRLLREPMVHFVVAGALIFTVTHTIEQAQTASARTIVVDSLITTRLSRLYELQLGAAPTPSQLNQLVDTYIHDEVLYREALALGLDKGDEIVRRRLVQKMGFLLSDAAPATTLDETALRAYYNANKADFARPAKFSLTQLYFGEMPTMAFNVRKPRAHDCCKIPRRQSPMSSTPPFSRHNI